MTDSNPNFDSLIVGAVQEPGGGDVWLDCLSRELEVPLKTQLLRMLGRCGRVGIEQLRFAKTRCPFCGARTDIIGRMESASDEMDHDWGCDCWSSFELCRRCLYWRWHFVDSEFQFRGGETAYRYTSYASKLQDFNPILPEGCRTDLAQWLRRKPDYWLQLNPRTMERFVADIYRANFGDADVMHVGRSRDRGVDVVMVRASGERWLIQVKRRGKTTAGHAEPPKTLRELLGTMVIDGARMGAVVTTADHFTNDAYAQAKRGREIGLVVELVDRRRLDDMVGRMLPREPWREALAGRFAAYSEWLQDKIAWSDDGSLSKAEEPTRISVATTERRLFLDDHGHILPLRLVASEPETRTRDERQLSIFSEPRAKHHSQDSANMAS